MKILVTGSNGLLGQKLTAILEHDRTVSLIATARAETGTSASLADFHLLDIANGANVEEVIQLTRPDVVINAAAMTQVDDCETDREGCWQSNVTAVEHLISACQKYHVHLVHVSTDFIFDGTAGLLNEDATPNPVNYYGQSKLAAEQLLVASKISWCILRTVLVFGVTRDNSRSNVILWVKKNLEQGKAIQVVNDQWRTPTLAEDLAAGCILAAKKRAKGIFNISGADYLSIYEIAVRTADFFKLDKSLIRETDSTHFKQPAKRPMKTGFVLDKARTELGYEPHTFEDALQVLAAQIQSS